MSLGENIKAKRNELKLSQEYVAEQLGVSRQAVSKWETDQSEPTAKNLTELAAIFQISLSELVEPQKYHAEQVAQESKWKEQQHNSKMICGRWFGYIFLITGYSGYAGYYNSGLSGYYWIAVLVLGIALLVVTSIDYFKKAQMKSLQLVLGLILICSVFLLPAILPFGNGLNVLIGHIVAFGSAAGLNLKFWRHIWGNHTMKCS